MNIQQKLTLVAAIVGAITTFLPWGVYSAGAFGYSVSQSVNGFHGSGVLYFFLMLGAGVIAVISKQSEFLQKYSRLIIMGFGAITLLLLIINLGGINGGASNPYGSVSSSIGFGMILGFLSSAGLIAIPLVVKLPDAPPLQDDFAALKNQLQVIQNNVNTKKTNNQPANPNRMEEMEKLITWRAEGKISQEEFDALKSKIM